ncbi:MAG: hypothetical protein P1U63_00725 [Coxiellaceae bacterium]|nr:hypothetical protein [Coxiellaceae bacterium]
MPTYREGVRPYSGTIQPAYAGQNKWRSLKYYDNGLRYFTLNGQKREILSVAGQRLLDWCKGSYQKYTPKSPDQLRPYQAMPMIRELRHSATQTSPRAECKGGSEVAPKCLSTTPEISIESTSLSEAGENSAAPEESKSTHNDQHLSVVIKDENSRLFDFPAIAPVDNKQAVQAAQQLGAEIEKNMRQSEQATREEKKVEQQARKKRRRLKYKHRHAKTQKERAIDRVIRNKLDVYVFNSKLRPRTKGRRGVHALKRADIQVSEVKIRPTPPTEEKKSSHIHTGLTVWQIKQRLYQRRCQAAEAPAEEKIKRVKSKLFQEKRVHRFLARQGSDLEYGSFGGSSGEASEACDQPLSPKQQ